MFSSIFKRSYEPRYTEFDMKNISFVSSGPIHHKLTMDWAKEVPEASTAPPKYLAPLGGVSVSDYLIEKPLEEYVTGSAYKGTHSLINFSGVGTYRYPHGVIYKGTFKDGQFHGNGTLLYPNGQRVEGVWRKGKLIDSIYTYSDGLQYQKNWNYLQMPNRAYMEEINCGFRPPGKELVSNKISISKIPPGAYETGDEGYYEDNKKLIYSKDNKIRRIVNADEVDLILNSYRQEADKPVKYYPQIYEYWCSGRQHEVEDIEKQYPISKVSRPSLAATEITCSDYSVDYITR